MAVVGASRVLSFPIHIVAASYASGAPFHAPTVKEERISSGISSIAHRSWVHASSHVAAFAATAAFGLEMPMLINVKLYVFSQA